MQDLCLEEFMEKEAFIVSSKELHQIIFPASSETFATGCFGNIQKYSLCGSLFRSII